MRQKTARATIKEVASLAGVSTQTVSRVINERPDVSPETRKRVQEVVQELGYQPSALARSLIRQRSYTLGVVTAGLRYIGPSRMLSGIAAVAEEAGYALLLKELSNFDENNIKPIFQALLSRHVDGIIWAVPEVGDNHAWVNEFAQDLQVPLVYLTMGSRENISSVSIDNYLGGRLAMAHLLDQGYKRIGHISGPLDWWEARQRKAAWKDSLQEAGLEVQDCQAVEGNWSSASGLQVIGKLLKQYAGLDSIFIANDQMALGAIQYIVEQGLRIPENIGIVGFDNISEAGYFSPPLTTVQQDQYHVARLAVEEVINIIDAAWEASEQLERQSIILPPTLVVRKSSLRKKENGGVNRKSIQKEEVPAQ